MRHIPNIITSLNLASGFVALIFAANGNIVAASWLILAAMVFDFLDGFSARFLNAYSDVGKELDSLADVVSFGVAPAFIIYNLLSDSSFFTVPVLSGNEEFKVTILLLFPVIMPVCAALRLAVFNTDPSQATSFKGLPTPANALAVISLVLAGNYSDIRFIDSFIQSPTSLMVLTFTLSLLMVSRLPMISLKLSHLRFKGNESRYIMVVLIGLALIFLGIGAASLIIPVYIIVSLASSLLGKS
jgi:CDP-diacylglycerol---serine O-phosphatidyltransferase